MSRARHLVCALVLAELAACDAVNIRPEAVLPTPLIVPIGADVGLIIPPDTRRFVDRETRFGVDWNVDLGPGEIRLLQDTFRDLFRHVEEFTDLPAATRSGKDVKALFETRLEQYSFVTARETGGRYYAVTIRYRIKLYSPQGEPADSYTLTGYGNALAGGMSGGRPLAQATVGAMRDAAAKFLVQFPQQPAGRLLAKDEAIVADQPATADAAQIEAVPIDEPGDEVADGPAGQPDATPSNTNTPPTQSAPAEKAAPPAPENPAATAVSCESPVNG